MKGYKLTDSAKNERILNTHTARRWLISTGTLACLLLNSNAHSESATLFVTISENADVKEQVIPDTLLKRPETFSLQRVDMNESALDNPIIEFTLDGKLLVAQRSRSEPGASGGEIWFGYIVDNSPSLQPPQADPLNEVILMRRNGRITGSIHVKGELYRIFPLKNGPDMLQKIDQGKLRFEPDDVLFADPATKPKATEITQKKSPCKEACDGSFSGPSVIETVRLMIVVPEVVLDNYPGDMQALIELGVAETNQGYLNSGAGLKLELAPTITTDYVPLGGTLDLDRLVRPSDGYMDEVHGVRNDVAADVVGMIAAMPPATCNGHAAEIGATAETAFFRIGWGCVTGWYLFGHEIGHLFGARHHFWIPPNFPDPVPDFGYPAYSHGYIDLECRWRTIMSGPCTMEPNKPSVINVWSNPSVHYQGVPVGTYEYNHNQRVLEENKRTVAGFR